MIDIYYPLKNNFEKEHCVVYQSGILYPFKRSDNLEVLAKNHQVVVVVVKAFPIVSPNNFRERYDKVKKQGQLRHTPKWMNFNAGFKDRLLYKCVFKPFPLKQ